jgi:hypothetical protein
MMAFSSTFQQSPKMGSRRYGMVPDSGVPLRFTSASGMTRVVAVAQFPNCKRGPDTAFSSSA